MQLISQRSFAIAKKLKRNWLKQNLYIIEMVCDWWAFSWIKGDLSEMFAWYKDHEAYIKLHNNTRSIVEEILEMIRTKLTEVENAEN